MKENGGSGLLLLYGSSIYNLLSQILPQYNWLPWKFNSVPNGYWDDLNNQKKFLDYLTKELNIKKDEDWYQISSEVIKFFLFFLFLFFFNLY